MKTEKKRSFRGAVLFTVVSVMSLLIVFLTSTLVLATAANNRAHKSYSSSQANYTARAAVDSILAAIKADNTFAHSVGSVSASSPTLTVNVKLDAAVTGVGRIEKALVKYEGTQKFFDSDENEWIDKDLLSVSADVLYAGETKTVTAYLLKNPPTNVKNPGGGGGFVTVGNASLDNHTNSFGGTYLGIGMGKGTRLYHGTYPGVGNISLDQRLYLNIPDDRKGSDYYDVYEDAKKDKNSATLLPVFSPQNNNTFEAPASMNGNFYVGNHSQLIIPTKKSGMAIWGNMSLNNSFDIASVNVNIENNYTRRPGESDDDYNARKKLAIGQFNEIPYIFVDGEIGQCQATTITLGNDTLPLNIFCGRMDMQQTEIYANVYCMDEGQTSKLGSNTTNLYKFSNSVINQTENLPDDISGNVYTKGNIEVKKATINGEVKAEGYIDIDNGCTIREDVVAGGNISIKNGTTIFGDVICGGDLYIDGNSKIYGSISCKGNMSIDPNAKIFGTINNDLHIGNVVKKIKPGYTYVSNEFHYDEPKPGYAIEENTKHENEVKLGYSEYGNIEVGVGPIKPEWTAEFNGAAITLPDGTTMSTNNDWTPVFYLNGTIYKYKPYERVDSDGNPTGEIVDYDYSYYRSDGSQCDNGEAKGTYYTEWNNPYQETGEQYYYYRLDEWGNYTDRCSKDEAWSDVGYYVRPNGEVVNADHEDAGVTFYNSSNNIVSSHEALDETTIQGVDDSLFNEIYPKKAEKAVILGFEEIGDGTPISDSKVVRTIDEIEADYNFGTTAITNIPPDSSDPTKLKTDAQEIKGGSYSDAFETINVSGDCTLSGTFNKKDIVIAASSGETWVRLDDTFNMTNSSRIIYDDSLGGELKLFIEGNVNTSATSSRPDGRTVGPAIITKTLDEALFTTTDDYQISIYDDVKKIPGAKDLASPRITIYSRKPAEGEAAPSLHLANMAIVTASIEAPYLDFKLTDVAEVKAHLYYNGQDLLDICDQNNKRVGVIGTLNVGALTEATNNWDFLYVPKSAGGPPLTITTPDEDLKFVVTYYEGF